MNLYLLLPVRDWEPWYDKNFGFVVRADCEDTARRIASKEASDEGADVWLNSGLTTCEPINGVGEHCVVIRNHRSA